jgi:hypothetical protein
MGSIHNLDGPVLFEVYNWIFGFFHTSHKILNPNTLFLFN